MANAKTDSGKTPTVLVSTVGTSLLTNQIDRSAEAEKTWYARLRDTANLGSGQTPDDVLNIIAVLQERAGRNLAESSVSEIRRASAELNGVYGFYENELAQHERDIHWLIATDTTQGQASAGIVQSFLSGQGISAQVYTPAGLSAKSTQMFTQGIDELITWLDELMPAYRKSGYQICFNLVGSFKSLQAYLNTIGMFYADEIIYIFEGFNSDLIRIPRLPLKIDDSSISNRKLEFAQMAAGTWLPESQVSDLPESLLFSAEDEYTLSSWGRLVWNQAKSRLLSQDLLPFPRLNYMPSFRQDYADLGDVSRRVKLQEVLAKVSYLLQKHHGDTGRLKGNGGVLYEIYAGKKGIAHFRVTQGTRVSCTADAGELTLRRYGKEPDVNKNP